MTAHDVMMHPSAAIQFANITAPDAAGDIAEPQHDVHRQAIGGRQRERASSQPWQQRPWGLPSELRRHAQQRRQFGSAGSFGQSRASGCEPGREFRGAAGPRQQQHSIPGDASEHGANPSHGAPSNAHGMSGGGGNAPSHSHGNNGSQTNPTIALNDDNLGAPEVSGNHGQAVASLAANSGEPPAHDNNNHSIPGDAERTRN